MLVGVYAFITVPKVEANPPSFVRSPISGQITGLPLTSTTTNNYITAGGVASTLEFDSAPGGTLYGSDSAILLMQYTATSSAMNSLKMRVEFSQDRVDWYPASTAINNTAINATTTQLTGNFAEYQWTVATSTDNGGSGISSRIHQSLVIPTPTRYGRVKFYSVTGNGGIWAEVVAKKQTF